LQYRIACLRAANLVFMQFLAFYLVIIAELWNFSSFNFAFLILHRALIPA